MDEEFKEDSSIEEKVRLRQNLAQTGIITDEILAHMNLSPETYKNIIKQSLIQIKSKIIDDKITGYEQIDRLLEVTTDFDRDFFDNAFQAIVSGDEELSGIASKCVHKIIDTSPTKIQGLYNIEEILGILSSILDTPMTKQKRNIFTKVILSATETRNLINDDFAQHLIDRITNSPEREDIACLLDIYNKLYKLNPVLTNELPNLLPYIEQFFVIGDSHIYLTILYFVNNTIMNCKNPDWLDSFSQTEFVEKIISSFSSDDPTAGKVIISIIYNLVGCEDGIRSAITMNQISNSNIIEILTYLATPGNSSYFKMVFGISTALLENSSAFHVKFFQSPIPAFIFGNYDNFEYSIKKDAMLLLKQVCIRSRLSDEIFNFLIDNELILKTIDYFEDENIIEPLLDLIFALVSAALKNGSYLNNEKFIEQIVDDDLYDALLQINEDGDLNVNDDVRTKAYDLILIRNKILNSD